MEMLSASQRPTPLVLQVQATPAQVSAFLVGGSYFDEVTYDARTDYSMIWCIGLMVGVPPSTEVAALRAVLPPSTNVQFSIRGITRTQPYSGKPPNMAKKRL